MRRLWSLLVGLLVALVAIARPALGAERRVVVVVYDGWGTPSSFVVGGRVLEDQGERAPSKSASEADNLVDNLKALESDEVRGAALDVTIGASTYTATTDDDGNFVVRAKGLEGKAALAVGAVPVSVRVKPLAGSATPKVQGGAGFVYVYPDAPARAVISDVDDTVVQSHVTDKLKLAATVLLQNAAQAEPVVGAPAAYRAAQAAGASGFFYVSGSPQNLHARIQAFLSTHGYPRGPILLKNLGDDELLAQQDYKLQRIERVLQAMPQLRVVLVGDSGERDPEIYAEVKKRHADRVLGIVIRKVPGKVDAAERFAGMVVVDDKYPNDGVIAERLRELQ